MMRSSISPFTAAQWQELEQQVLIFRYMASGSPVPSELILPIRSLLLHSTNTTSYQTVAFLPPQPTIGWGCFHKDFGRKAEDPEPGRCRRTDGKKWRCSREAYPDSKYCERHMHRGKNRSRKLVEMSATTTAIPTTFFSHPYCPYPPPLCLHSHPSTSSKSPGIGLPLHYSNTYFHSDTASHSSTENAYRQYHGMADAVYEKNVLSEICEADRGSCRQSREMLSFDELKQMPLTQPRTCSNPCKELLSQEEKHRHCFVLGADFMSGEAVKVAREEEDRKPRLLRCFFDDGRLQNKDTLDPEDQLNPASYTNTQLSISIPMTHHDFF